MDYGLESLVIMTRNFSLNMSTIDYYSCNHTEEQYREIAASAVRINDRFKGRYQQGYKA